MKPPAPSAFPDRPTRERDRRRAVPALARLLAWTLLLGCTGSEWPDRDPLIVDPAPVDSLEFLPAGSRYILEDSLTPVLFRFRQGYACTRLTAFRLEPWAAPGPAGYVPRLGLELPSQPTCPIDSAARDSVLPQRFASADGPVVRLLDSLGAVLDTALMVRGMLSTDSLKLKASEDTAARGRFRYRDTTGARPRELAADSLAPCEFLNHAEFLRTGDTLTVRYSWVTLDAASQDSCGGTPRGDTVYAIPARR